MFLLCHLPLVQHLCAALGAFSMAPPLGAGTDAVESKSFITWQIRNSFGVSTAVAFVGGTCRPTAAAVPRRLLLPSETSSRELLLLLTGSATAPKKETETERGI